MPFRPYLIIFLCLLSGLLPCVAKSAAASAAKSAAKGADTSGCELVVRTYTFPPLAHKDQDDQWQGMDIDTTKVLLDQAGCRYTFIDMPWARAMRMMKVGQVDMMLNVSKTPERERDFYFVGPQRHEEIRFVTKKGRFPKISHWHQLETLKATLLRQQGTFKGKRLEHVLNNSPILKERLIILPYDDVKIELIAKDRADGFFAEIMYLANQLATNPAFSIVEIHPLVIYKAPVYFAFSREGMSIENMKKINAAHEHLVKTGALKAIVKRYSVRLD